MIPFAARTHPGLRREANEDSFFADAEQGLWIVADGLGGHSNGEIASAIACEVIRNDVAEGVSLVDAIEHAHQEVLKEINRRDLASNMGTTVVVLRMQNKHYEIAWVGDSRAYLFDGRLSQLTSDHSTVSELLASGAIDEKGAATHPQRHALSRSLGVSDRIESRADTISGTLKRGQQLFLCTDGVTDELSDTEIQGELRINESPEQQVDALVKSILANGGRDNLTMILVGAGSPGKVVRGEEPANLEITQNIGDPAAAVSPRRQSMGYGVALILVAAIIAGVAMFYKVL